MATDLLSFIPRSLDENVVKNAQNQGIKESAAQGSATVDTELANKLEQTKAVAEIQSQQDLAQIMLATRINEEQGRLTTEIDGTRQVLNAQGNEYEKQLAEYMKLTQDAKGYSFFTNPIATIRNQVKLQQKKQQLNDMVDGLDAGAQHIDNEYALSAQRVQDFKSTVLNVNQANLNLKAHEVATQAQEADLKVAAEKQKIDIKTKAIQQQQFVTPDRQLQAENRLDKSLLENETYKTMYVLANNGSEDGWSPAAAKVQAQLYQTLPANKQEALGRTTNKRMLMPGLVQEDGETKTAFAERKMQNIIATAGAYDAAEVAELAAGMGTTKLNPLFKLGADNATTQIMATAEDDYAKELGTTVELMTPAQRQMSYKLAKAKIDTIPAAKKVEGAAAVIQNDLTNRASMGTTAIPPFDQAGAAELMASANVAPEAAAWFASDTAKQSISHWINKTGKQAPDVALNIMDGLQEVKLSNGKQMSDADRARVAATYVREMFKKDYLANGDHGESFAALSQISPGSDLKFQANIKLPQYGSDKVFDLTNPEDLLNLQSRLKSVNADLAKAREVTTKMSRPSSVPGLFIQ